MYVKFKEYPVPQWMNPHAKKIREPAALKRFTRLMNEKRYLEKKRARR